MKLSKLKAIVKKRYGSNDAHLLGLYIDTKISEFEMKILNLKELKEEVNK